ncbi:MAG: PAS domain S-box protein [Bacillota bacterium]|jgi:diguanylate cyclase (GGDEF)-like protein/PAS domain S-box-containing protein
MGSGGKISAHPGWEQLELDLATGVIYNKQGQNPTGLVSGKKSADLWGKALLADVENVYMDPAELLRESENRYRLLFENSADGICLMTDIIYDCNRQFCKILASRRKDVIGRSPAELSPVQQPNGRNSAEYAAHLIKAALAGTPQYFYWQHQRKDGALIDTEVSLNTVAIGGRQFLQTTLRDITGRKRMEEALRKSEVRYRALADSLPEVVFEIDISGRLVYVNKNAFECFGYTEEDFAQGLHTIQMVIPGDRNRVRRNIQRVFKGEHMMENEYVALRKDGSTFPVIIHCSPVHQHNRPVGLRGILIDITERKRSERALQQALDDLKEMEFIIDKSPAVAFLWQASPGWPIEFVTKNIGQFGYAREELTSGQIPYTSIIHPLDLGRVVAEMEEFSGHEGAKDFVREYRILTSGGEVRWVDERTWIRRDREGRITHYQGIIVDITERKRVEERLVFYSMHDQLTGLYNRAYFEQEMQRLQSGRQRPVGLIVCDADGLKFVNDTLGHGTGDNLLVAVAGILRQSFREGDLIARIGGDEFAILVAGGDKEAMEKACLRIKNNVDRYNAGRPDLPVSISTGYAVGEAPDLNLRDIFKEADNNMYREKLHRSQHARSAIIQTLLKALEARDFIAEGHTDRLQKMVAALGAELGLSESRMNDLRLLAQFHDIGKVGIPDRILLKPGSLTAEESAEMQRHCEIGYRIALSVPDLMPVADWILKHHEWWDGSGHPLGLKGEEIPLECRILAIADAYDAMTSDRPYRYAPGHEYAMAELKEFAGKQFDPLLVKRFIKLLEEISA